MDASTSSDHESISHPSMLEESVLVQESLDFLSPWHFSDVVLVVDDINMHVHKCILSLWSPVFSTMFTSQFKESKAKEIRLPGKRAEEMEVLLKLIYSSGTKQTVTDENYQFLVQLADEYQMDRVKSMCSEFLVNKIQVSNCLEFFKLAEQYGLKDVTEKCHQEVRYKSSADLEGSEHFNGFEPEFKVDICMKIIKELERTLQEYMTTCSDLVQKVYKVVYEYFYSNISSVSLYDEPIRAGEPKKRLISVRGFMSHGDNEQLYSDPSKHAEVHSRLHEEFKNELANAETGVGHCSLNPKDYNTKYFMLSCSLCLKQVQAIPWNNNGSYSILKEPVNKLYALLHRGNRGIRPSAS